MIPVKVKTHKTKTFGSKIAGSRDFRGNIMIALYLVGYLYINFWREISK